MIIKEIDPTNLSKLVLRLTPKGEIAYVHHGMIHEEFDNIVNQVLKDASRGSKSILKEIFELY